MKIEDIEKAASELCTTEGQEEWLKDYGKNCFMDGARWRINSVWHDNSIRPGEDCDVLVETKRGIEMDRYDIDYNELDNGTDWEMEVIKWAYVSDLLPERKEETNGGR